MISLYKRQRRLKRRIGILSFACVVMSISLYIGYAHILYLSNVLSVNKVISSITDHFSEIEKLEGRVFRLDLKMKAMSDLLNSLSEKIISQESSKDLFGNKTKYKKDFQVKDLKNAYAKVNDNFFHQEKDVKSLKSSLDLEKTSFFNMKKALLGFSNTKEDLSKSIKKLSELKVDLDKQWGNVIFSKNASFVAKTTKSKFNYEISGIEKILSESESSYNSLNDKIQLLSKEYNENKSSLVDISKKLSELKIDPNKIADTIILYDSKLFSAFYKELDNKKTSLDSFIISFNEKTKKMESKLFCKDKINSAYDYEKIKSFLKSLSSNIDEINLGILSLGKLNSEVKIFIEAVFRDKEALSDRLRNLKAGDNISLEEKEEMLLGLESIFNQVEKSLNSKLKNQKNLSSKLDRDILSLKNLSAKFRDDYSSIYTEFEIKIRDMLREFNSLTAEITKLKIVFDVEERTGYKRKTTKILLDNFNQNNLENILLDLEKTLESKVNLSDVFIFIDNSFLYKKIESTIGGTIYTLSSSIDKELSFYKAPNLPVSASKEVKDIYEYAISGDPFSMYKLATYYTSFTNKNYGLAEDRISEFYWYKRSAELGYENAYYNLSNLYEYGIGTPKNLKKALYFTLAYMKNNPSTFKANLDRVSSIYNKMGNKSEAFLWSNASKGHASALQEVKETLNIIGPVEVYLTEKENANVKALNKNTENNVFVVRASRSKALEESTELSESNELPDSASVVAKSYYKKALEGDALSMNALANCYSYKKEGLPKDDQKVFYWNLKAAQSGFTNSYFIVSNLYKSGIGVRKDLEKALYWGLKSAKSTRSSAWYKHVSDIYVEMGDKVQSALWLYASRNDKSALAKVNSYLNSM